MNTSHRTHLSSGKSQNLIGQAEHRLFVNMLAAYGVAHRGGTVFPRSETQHHARLVHNVNLLQARERKQLIFSQSIFSN